jgi:hypothetical protein
MTRGPLAALDLQPSEAQVVAAASRLLAAHIASGRVSDESLEVVLEECVRLAVQIAVRVDRHLQSDDEPTGLGKRDAS